MTGLLARFAPDATSIDLHVAIGLPMSDRFGFEAMRITKSVLSVDASQWIDEMAQAKKGP
ncbi:MAG: hypothetical protein ACI9JR_002723 [Gammaproteobacteria bacterium]|jgi:hypothetical protein